MLSFSKIRVVFFAIYGERNEITLFELFFIFEGDMKESEFQGKLIKEIKQRFPGCIVLKNDSSYIQGIPDLLILYEENWAALECKRSSSAHRRPNQEYYVEKMDAMSFASFIFPENKEDVLDDMEHTFERRSRRRTRHTRSKQS